MLPVSTVRGGPSGPLILTPTPDDFAGFGYDSNGSTNMLYTRDDAFSRVSPGVGTTWTKNSKGGGNWTINPLTGVVTYHGKRRLVVSFESIMVVYPEDNDGRGITLQAAKNGPPLEPFAFDPLSNIDVYQDPVSFEALGKSIINQTFEVTENDTLEVVAFIYNAPHAWRVWEHNINLKPLWVEQP